MDERNAVNDVKADEKPAWETPSIEEVTDRVMAQPYIRFT
jgi:hypothetical protein